MARHRFDPVSFVFGALAIASGVVVLAGRSLAEDARVLVPAGLIALGVALLVKVAGRGAATAARPPAAEPVGARHAGGGGRAEGPVDAYRPIDGGDPIVGGRAGSIDGDTLIGGNDTPIDGDNAIGDKRPIGGDDTPIDDGGDRPAGDDERPAGDDDTPIDSGGDRPAGDDERPAGGDDGPGPGRAPWWSA